MRVRSTTARAAAKTASERRAFEKWWRSYPATEAEDLDRNGNGYAFDGVQTAWDAWQARAALSAAKQEG